MNKLINITIDKQLITLHYDKHDCFIKILANDLIRIGSIEASNYQSYAANDFQEEIKITIENNIITFANKKIIANDDFMLEIYEDNILLSKDIPNTYSNIKETSELLELEGHKVEENDTYSFIIGKQLNPNDKI